METEDGNGLSGMCRACMSKDQNFHSLLEYIEHPLRICEMLATTTPQLLIQAGDLLPEVICNVCLNKLNIAYQFQQMCINSDRRMRAMLLSDAAEMTAKAELPQEISLPPPPSQSLRAEPDPLLEEGLLQLKDCLKSEIDFDKREEEEKQYDLANLLDHVPEIKLNREYQRDSSGSDLTESEEEDSGETKPAVKNKVPSKKKDDHSTFTSNIHNETGTDEIEKPDVRNRRNGHFPCAECGKVFDRPYRLRRHAGVHSIKRPYECDICKYRFVTVKRLVYHKTTHNEDSASKLDKQMPPDGFRCPECPRRFAKRESLSAHIQSHRKASPGHVFKCEFCPKVFKKFTYLTKHARTHPENQKFNCHLCDKTFALNAHLIEHLTMHDGVRKYVCIYCDKAFQQSGTLKEHVRVHTGEKPFLCQQCGKSFQNSSNMRQHILRHSGEKRYQCPECPSKFACQSDQIKHMSIHRGSKPHVCDICGSSFTRSYTLSKHKHIHTGLRPHKCEECNMTFVFIDHMRRHMRTHTGEKPYKCAYCDRAYAESGDLNKHMRSHVGEKTYKCKQCPEAFKYQTELRDHQIYHYKERQQQVESKSGLPVPAEKSPNNVPESDSNPAL